MKKKIPCFLLPLFFALGCAQEKSSQTAQTFTNVVEGIGIPNYLEIGMRLDNIPNRIPGASCEPTTHASLFWWCGESKWKKHPPWATPALYRLEIPSLGATIYEHNSTDLVQQIHFTVIRQYDWPYFSGTLSGGLSFSATNAVSLTDVIAQYGEPMHTLVYPVSSRMTQKPMTNGMGSIQREEAILSSGESLLWTYADDDPYRLYYPARGVYFDIENREVRSFRIFKRVEQPH